MQPLVISQWWVLANPSVAGKFFSLLKIFVFWSSHLNFASIWMWFLLMHHCLQFTLACMKMERTELAEKAVALAEKRLPCDSWPEYYDTRSARFVGKQARLYQTWTLAGYLASKMFLKNPKLVSLLSWDEDLEILETCVCLLHKSGRIKCSRHAAKSQILVWSERGSSVQSRV